MSDIIKAEIPEGFSDLAVRVGNYRESQKGYSPLLKVLSRHLMFCCRWALR